MKVFFTAAHHGFPQSVPLGGGAAVCRKLLAQWARKQPFPVEVLDPSILGAAAPQGKDLVEYSEKRYADFCLAFEAALTERLRRENPAETVVLANDVSEGPSFKALALRGYPIYTIYHVDVVDYFTRAYLRGRIAPERLTRFYARIDGPTVRRWLPNILHLIWPKQQDSVRYSKGLIVPSHGMKDVLLRCYPTLNPARIHVIPWGVDAEPIARAEIDAAAAQWRKKLALGGSPVLLTLSRISPEKRQDRLLSAMLEWESRADYPPSGITVVIAGEVAFMQGARFERRLRQLAARLKKTKVHFCGYAAGAAKQALLELADLYIFPSEHESYGLTLLEAMAAGATSVACYTHGAQEVMAPSRGILLPPLDEKRIGAALRSAIVALLRDHTRRRELGQHARAYAATQHFENAAAQVARLLQQAVGAGEPVHE